MRKMMLRSWAAVLLSSGFAMAQTNWIENSAIRAAVSREYPLVAAYERKDAGRFLGAEENARWTISVIRPDRSEATIPPSGVSITPTMADDHAAYQFTCRLDGSEAVSFLATISLEGDQVVYRIGQIRPAEGYRLRRVDFGRAIRVAMASDAPEAMVAGGRIDRQTTCFYENPGSAKPRSESATDIFMLCQEKAVAVGYNNLVVDPWRARSGPSDGTLAEFHCPPFTQTVWAGKGESYTTGTVSDEFICRIGILADRSGDGEIDWRDGASFIRDNLPGGVPLFQDWLVYSAGIDFDKDLDTIKSLYNFLDGRRLMCSHNGWQYWGWDSEYPAYMEPSDERGGRAAMYNLMREAPKYRAIVSIIHNWDDAYKHSPAWDEKLIMRKADQSLQEATAWAGGRSYRTGHFKMVHQGFADKVIDGLVAQGARIRMFSDVLSTSGERIDYDKDMPCDALATLVLGKFKIIEMLKERGIALASESVTWPYIGKLTSAHSLPLGISDKPEEIPLAPFVLHGKIAYQVMGRAPYGPDSMLAGVDNQTGWDADGYYMWHLVLAKYADKPMTNYTRKDGVFRSEFGPGTFVQWNANDKTFQVVVDGKLIATDSASFTAKQTANVCLAYVRGKKHPMYADRAEQVHRFPRPAGWDDPSQLIVHRLSSGPEMKVNASTFVALEGDEIVMRLSKGTPYRVCYGQAAYEADRKLRETPLEQPNITWPEDVVLQTTPPGPRPNWVRATTRPELKGSTLYVGCGAKFPTIERSRQHAADIIASKIQWAVRQTFVHRSRDYQQRLGITTQNMGFDNWNLGIDEPYEVFSAENLLKRGDVQWYTEKLEDKNPQLGEKGPHVAYKVFAAVPVSTQELHDIYVLAIRNNLDKAKTALSAEPNSEKLQKRVQIWTVMLEQESQKRD